MRAFCRVFPGRVFPDRAKGNRQGYNRRVKAMSFGLATLLAAGLSQAIAANQPPAKPDPTRFDSRLPTFFAEKEKQARALAKTLDSNVAPEVWDYLNAGAKGDWATATNLYEHLRKRAGQYADATNDPRVTTPVWQAVIETICTYQAFDPGEKKYSLAFAHDIIKSIPPGSIYFGGTDPGRALITAYSKSHERGEPFFTVTQNALASSDYLAYLRFIYGSRIYIPSTNDAQRCFQEYLDDAAQRMRENKLKPGEDVTVKNNRVTVRGQTAVMAINGLLAKLIFDKNPDRQFYVEESFPLDWMYPYLSPNGLIMKVNRQPLEELSAETVRQNHDYWTRYVRPLIGNWLKSETSPRDVTAFTRKVYLNHDFSDFKGDPRFVRNNYSCKMFSKLRSSQGGLYVWRMDHAHNESEKARMAAEADFAFRQALALCPYSPEAVFRYAALLHGQKRTGEALEIAESAAQFPPEPGSGAPSLRDLVQKLKESQGKE